MSTQRMRAILCDTHNFVCLSAKMQKRFLLAYLALDAGIGVSPVDVLSKTLKGLFIMLKISRTRAFEQS